jgi:hypothetical protein
MEPEKVIAIFLQWLHENPSIFTPTAWKRLPQLEEEIAESADDELFPIAFTISKWCGKNGLGEQLRDCLRQKQKRFRRCGRTHPKYNTAANQYHSNSASKH